MKAIFAWYMILSTPFVCAMQQSNGRSASPDFFKIPDLVKKVLIEIEAWYAPEPESETDSLEEEKVMTPFFKRMKAEENQEKKLALWMSYCAAVRDASGNQFFSWPYAWERREYAAKTYADIHFSNGSKAMRAFIEASRHKDVELLKVLLQDSEIDRINEGERHMLFYSCTTVEFATPILQRGIPLYRSILHDVAHCEGKSAALIKLYRSYGADPLMPDRDEVPVSERHRTGRCGQPIVYIAPSLALTAGLADPQLMQMFTFAKNRNEDVISVLSHRSEKGHSAALLLRIQEIINCLKESSI